MSTRTALSSIAPFFDRLCGVDFTIGNGIHLDAKGFQSSLLLDLFRLLNTRCDLTIDEFLNCQAHVMNYGLPATNTLSPNSKTDLLKMEQLVQHVIKLFEPRLKQVRVKAQSNPLDTKSVMVEIQAAVVFGEQILRFAPSFHLHPGQVELVVQPEAV